MKFKFTFLLAVAFSVPSYSFAMSKGSIDYAVDRGPSQVQLTSFNSEAGDSSVLIRGHAAEVVYKNLNIDAKSVTQSAALDLIGGKAQQSEKVGSLITCSEIRSGKKADYACSVTVDSNGKLAVNREPFDTKKFDLATNYGGATNLFKAAKNTAKAGRSLASVDEPKVYGSADVYFVKPKEAKKDLQQAKAENMLVVVTGPAAEKIYDEMSIAKDAKNKSMGDAIIFRGEHMACVQNKGAKKAKNARCTFTVSRDSGAVVRDLNPLF